MADSFNILDRGVITTASPVALTQTYATADPTHANLTSAAVATSTAVQVTPFGYASAAQADAVVTAVNAVRTDLTDLKQFVNSIADQLQAKGLAS